jgi:hypothetical protein
VHVRLDRGLVLRILSILPDCGDDEYESSSSSTELSETSESSPSGSTETSESSQAPPSSDTETSESTRPDGGAPPSNS